MTQQQLADRARPRAVGDGLTFIGNATVLLRYGGLTVLTDPNFVHAGESVPLGYGLSTTRLRDPALEIDDLPPLDLVVLSHFHGDHFDRVAEDRLERTVPIVTTPDAAEILADKGFANAVALRTWQAREILSATTRLRITALPGRHAPGPLSIALPEVMGSLLEFEPIDPGQAAAALRLYITGDTVMYEGLREIPHRTPAVDLALLHLGGTRVMGVTVTMDAGQGVEILRTIGPRRAVPIHFDDYDAFASPLEDWVAAVEAAGLADRVRHVPRGATVPLPVP